MRIWIAALVALIACSKSAAPLSEDCASFVAMTMKCESASRADAAELCRKAYESQRIPFREYIQGTVQCATKVKTCDEYTTCVQAMEAELQRRDGTQP